MAGAAGTGVVGAAGTSVAGVVGAAGMDMDESAAEPPVLLDGPPVCSALDEANVGRKVGEPKMSSPSEDCTDCKGITLWARLRLLAGACSREFKYSVRLHIFRAEVELSG